MYLKLWCFLRTELLKQNATHHGTYEHFVRPVVDPPRSCDCHDDGHMTTAVRHRSTVGLSKSTRLLIYT